MSGLSSEEALRKSRGGVEDRQEERTTTPPTRTELAGNSDETGRSYEEVSNKE